MRRREWLKAAAAAGLALRAGQGAAAPLLQVFGTAPARVERVFAAGPPAAVLLYALAPERLLGWPMRLGDAARALLAAPASERPLLGRLSGRGSTLPMEALLALKPDLVLDAGSVDGTYASTARRVAAQTGLPYALLDGRLADSPRQLRETGALLGVPARAEALAAAAEAILARTALVRGARQPGVYLARGSDGLETALAGAINAEVIEAAGGRNVAAGARGGVARVSMEELLAWAPDWIVTQDPAFFRHARGDDLWRSLAAVREGRLALLPALPFGWIDGPPGINRLAGVQWLAARLDGAEVPMSRTLAEAQAFYRLFYGVELTREALQAQFDGRA